MMEYVCDGVARWVKVQRDCCCGVSLEWIVLCLYVLYKTFAECAFSLTTEYIVFTPFTFNQKC